MKIDSAIKEFVESYDSEMLESIDIMSKELRYSANRCKFPVFNLNESVSAFVIFLEGYGDYKIKHLNDENKIGRDEIMENTKKFIESECFKEAGILYPEIPNFIKSYTDAIKTLSETTDKVKSAMTSNEVDYESVGDVNEMVDCFTEKMQEKFHPIMEKMLWASGYNARRKLSMVGKTTSVKGNNEPIFI